MARNRYFSPVRIWRDPIILDLFYPLFFIVLEDDISMMKVV